MIFVVLGTQKFQFNRLLELVDSYVAAGKIQEEVYAQIGNSDYEPQHYKYQRFYNNDDFEKMISAAEVIITHAGVGSIITANNMGKPTIVFPRLAKYKEHIDDHQLSIANVFDEKGFVLKMKQGDDLAELIEKSKNMKFNKYKPKDVNMLNIIMDFLEKN